MIALCTGRATASMLGRRVRVSVPSGDDMVEIVLSLDEAMRLSRSIQAAAVEGFAAIEAISADQVVPFRKPGRRRHV